MTGSGRQTLHSMLIFAALVFGGTYLAIGDEENKGIVAETADAAPTSKPLSKSLMRNNPWALNSKPDMPEKAEYAAASSYSDAQSYSAPETSSNPFSGLGIFGSQEVPEVPEVEPFTGPPNEYVYPEEVQKTIRGDTSAGPDAMIADSMR